MWFVSRVLPDGYLLCLLYSDLDDCVTSSIQVYGIFHPFSCFISQKTNDTLQSTLSNTQFEESFMYVPQIVKDNFCTKSECLGLHLFKFQI